MPKNRVSRNNVRFYEMLLELPEDKKRKIFFFWRSLHEKIFFLLGNGQVSFAQLTLVAQRLNMVVYILKSSNALGI